MSGNRTSLKLFIYNRNEEAGPWWKTAQWTWDPTIRGRYFGVLLKGWWKFGTGEINRHFEVEFAVGGEDNMIQVGFVLPFLLRWHVGVRVPHWLTNGWVYQRREWTIRIGYIGRSFELLLGFDDSAHDMRDYYRRKFKGGTYDGPWRRLALWPGLRLALTLRPRDWLLGRPICKLTKGNPQAVVIPMPEGNYDGVMTREERVWQRKRWPWASKTRTDYWIELEQGIPVPGKGENSWDCEDDAIHGTGGYSPAEAIANVTKAALRQRERYATRNWSPTNGWPERRP